MPRYLPDICDLSPLSIVSSKTILATIHASPSRPSIDARMAASVCNATGIVALVDPDVLLLVVLLVDLLVEADDQEAEDDLLEDFDDDLDVLAEVQFISVADVDRLVL